MRKREDGMDLGGGTSERRGGLLLIAASLVAIFVTCAVVVEWQRDARRDRGRAQGASLARLLSSMDPDRILRPGGGHGALQVVRHSQTNPDFAYAVVVGRRGEPIAQEVVAGVVVPPAALPESPAAWFGERVLSASDGSVIREYHAPLMRDTEWLGEIRVGFREPSLALLIESAPLLGQVALAIFLITPVAYALMRFQLRPVAAVTRRLEQMLASEMRAVEVSPDERVSGFIDRFDCFVGLVEDRMGELRGETHQIKASARVLGYQKARVEGLVEALPEAFVALDERGVGSFASGRLLPLLGVEPDQATGHPFAEWCAIPELQELVAPHLGAQPRQRSSGPVEITPAHRPDEFVAASVHPLPAGDAEGSPGCVLALRDVTAERLARRAQSDFATHVAHELKNPLNVIDMYCQSLLADEGGSPDFRLEACNVMRDEVERVSTLTSSLLTISRIQAGTLVMKRQRVRLSELLTDVFETIERSARGRELRFRLDLPKELPVVHVDKELLRVALNNLLTNAVKYNREDGEVVLAARLDEDQIEIQVSDTGLGIREEEIDSIFEKFFRSDDPEVRKRSGHGLGLALVNEVSALHGAEVCVESVPGEGSIFSIRLPKSAVGVDEEIGT